MEFAYNNLKNTSMKYISFKLNCEYHPHIPNKEDVNSRFRSKVANELIEKLRNLIAVWRENLQHIQKL